MLEAKKHQLCAFIDTNSPKLCGGYWTQTHLPDMQTTKEERKESKRQEIELFFRKMPFKTQIEIIEYLKVKVHKKLTQN